MGPRIQRAALAIHFAARRQRLMLAQRRTGVEPVRGSLSPQAFVARVKQAQRYVAIALGFSIPLSTALDNVLAGLLLLLWLIGGEYRTKLETIRNHPVALAALALFAVSIVAMMWNTGTTAEGLVFVRKYSNLLLIPILVTVFTEPQDRSRGLIAFSIALIATLLASYALAIGVLPPGGVILGTMDDPSAFKYRISHNVLMAFACLLFAQFARNAAGRARWAWALLALLALINVMLMVKGRTGYVILVGLTLLWIGTSLRWKGLLAALLLIGAGFGVLYQVSASFHARVNQTTDEATQWRPGVATETSVGLRLEFYRNTVEIIQRHPLLGVGTGGFAKVYEDQVRGTPMAATHNPHNLYLLLAVQFGILGLAALAMLFYAHWRCARRLPMRSDAVLAYGILLTLALGGLFNSMLIDHTESMLFAWVSGLLFGGLSRPA